MLLRRGWRIALLQTVPLARRVRDLGRGQPEGLGAGELHARQSPVQVIKFVVIGTGDAVRPARAGPRARSRARRRCCSSGSSSRSTATGLGALRGRFAVPLALLVGAGVFLLVTALVRSGQPATHLRDRRHRARARAPEPLRVPRRRDGAARRSAIAADAIARQWRVLTIPVVVLLLAGVPGNLHQLRIYTNQSSVDPGA